MSSVLVAQVLSPWILKSISALAVVVLIQHSISGHDRLTFSSLSEFRNHQPLLSHSASTMLADLSRVEVYLVKYV